jgi:hypothetical protein
MSDHENAFETYTRSVQLLMLDFQFIEELLKIVIGCSYEALRRSAPPLVRFRPTRFSVERESLGRLISRFEEVSGNDALIKELRAVVQDRNFCAHRSLVLSLEKQHDVTYLGAERERLVALRKKTEPCVMALTEEFGRFADFLKEGSNIMIEKDAPVEAGVLPAS